MKPLLYLTTNEAKIREAKEILIKDYGINIEIVKPDFEILEIQAKNCADVAGFSAKYAAEKMGKPVLKSDCGLYIDALGGLPGPYNAYFDRQIGTDKFLNLIKNEKNRKARVEQCFAYCEPGREPILFSGFCEGTISKEAKGDLGRWHDKFFIPNGTNETLSQIRKRDSKEEYLYWGDAKEKLAQWYFGENM